MENVYVLRGAERGHELRAGELIFHIRTLVLAMVEKRTATKPVANTSDSTPPKREEQLSGMIAVSVYKHTSTQCLLFVYEFASDIDVGSKPMGTKNAQIRIWTNSRLSGRG